MLKNEKIKANPLKKTDKSNTLLFCRNKIETFQNMITRTILAVQKYKVMDIVGASDMNVCIQNLETLFKQLNNLAIKINYPKQDFEEIITHLQKINNELSALFRTTGTQSIEDLITVAMGSDFLRNIIESDNKHIFEVIKTYIHPINYKVMTWREDNKKTNKSLAKNRIVEDFMIVETSKNFDCFDLARTSKEFQKKVYGIKVSIHNETEKKTLIISGVVDDILIECTNHSFIDEKMIRLHKSKPEDPDFQEPNFDRFLESLTIKEILIYSDSELYQRFIGYVNQTNLIKQKTHIAEC